VQDRDIEKIMIQDNGKFRILLATDSYKGDVFIRVSMTVEMNGEHKYCKGRQLLLDMEENIDDLIKFVKFCSN